MSSFIYDNFIQRGIDYNTSTQDGYIPVNNLYKQLGDSYGGTSVYTLNSNQVPVLQQRSDGYLGILGNLSVNNHGLTNTPYITINDTTAPVSIFLLNANPNGVVTGTKASIGMNYNDGYLYSNFNGATNWSRYATLADVTAASAETLQQAYNNSTPATITTNSTNGNLTVAGTQALAVTATNGLTVSTGFNQTSATGSFNVALAAGSFNLSNTGSNSTINTTSGSLLLSTTTSGSISVNAAQKLDLYGQQGIVVDGYGFGIVPAVSNSDALGSATAGFSNLYVENIAGTAVVALSAAGTAGAPSTTAGAAAVGTNKLNFTNFGPSMTSNTVEAALEAIDGYFTTIKTATRTQIVSFPLAGAILNGVAAQNNYSETPSIDMGRGLLGIGAVSKMLYTWTPPSDLVTTGTITVNVLWAPQSTNTGNVQWVLEYKVLNLTNLITTAATSVTYNQAASGTTGALQSTGTNLVIPASTVSSANSVLVFNILRNGTNAGDTYTGTASVVGISLSYTGTDI